MTTPFRLALAATAATLLLAGCASDTGTRPTPAAFARSLRTELRRLA